MAAGFLPRNVLLAFFRARLKGPLYGRLRYPHNNLACLGSSAKVSVPVSLNEKCAQIIA